MSNTLQSHTLAFLVSMGAQSLGTAALAHLAIGTSTSASDIDTLHLIYEFVLLLRRGPQPEDA